MKETTKGTLAMIATALLWSIGGIFIKLVPWNPLAIAGLRGLIGGLVWIFSAEKAAQGATPIEVPHSPQA